MKVGIIGSGGREHAICETVKKSNFACLLGTPFCMIEEK